MVDLGDALLRGDAVVAQVPEALRLLRSLRTASGAPLELALVSDYTMAPADARPDAVGRLFEEYVALVRGRGLLDFFEPPAKHVTLSTQAGVRKPDAKIFELALVRLGLPPDLETAMFTTGDATQVAACRALGMTVWQYGVDFADWSEAPPLVSRTLARDAAVYPPDEAARREARYYQSLEDNAAVAPTGAPMPPGTTHSSESVPGRWAPPKRRRYSLK
jgi:FMN phosphatase YigB (HAD superfamily)